MRHFFVIVFLLFNLFSLAQDIRIQLADLDTLFYRDDYAGANKLADKIYARKSEIKDDTVLVEFLNTRGSIQYRLQEYTEAIRFFDEAASLAQVKLGEKDYRYALALFNKAGGLKELGRLTEAEPLYLKSLPVLAEAFGQNSLDYTRCFYTLASLYLESSRLQEAESMVAAAVNYYKVNPGQTSDDYLGALGTMGVIYQNQGRYDKAEEVFISLKNYYGSLATPPAATMQTLENNLGELYRHMGDYEKAEPFLQRAVKMAGNSLAAAYSLNNLGLVQKAMGQYAEAERSYRNAIKIYQQAGKTSHPDYTNPVNNLGELYRTMARYQDAVYAFEEVIQLREKTLGKLHPNYANALNNLALVEFTMGMYAEAEEHLLECKEIYKTTLGEKDKFYANCLNNLASVYKASGKLSKAEEMYKECLRIYKEGYGDDTDKYALYLGGLAGTYRLMKNYKEAIPLTLKSLGILKNRLGVNHYDYIETQYNLAETYREAAQYSEAEKNYLESMQGYLFLIEKYFPYLSEKDKTSFYYNVSNAFETFNSYVISRYLADKNKDFSVLVSRMYDNQVALKSLLLKESEKLRNAIARSPDKTIREDYKNWLQVREQIVRYYRLTSEEQASIGQSLAQLEKQANDLEQKLNIASNIKTSGETKLTWKDVQRGLKPGEVAIEIIRTDFYDEARWTDTVHYSALIIEPGYTAPRFVILQGNELEKKAIGLYRKSLKSKVPDDFSYQSFWAPLKNVFQGKGTVYFSPDGVYQQVNLYTLKNPSTGKFLVDETEIHLVTNTRDILQAKLSATNKQAVLFSFPDYGNTKKTVSTDSTRVPGFPDLTELPGTLAESDSVKAILRREKWNVTEHLRKSATEEMVKKTSKPAILHIATHGFFLKNVKDDKGKTLGMESGIVKQNPLLRSGLIMAGAAAAAGNVGITEGDDGILTAYEATGLDLNGTELVVLSACETGLGELLNGQGVYGLQRSFLVAGANAVLMSLWKIDDIATQKLMVQFYKQLIKDPAGGKQKALKEAQLTLREEFAHPYYWGAFIVVGD